jgi:N-acyl amino acid synthase of PEP-CTERM/exosortase system
MTAKTPPSGGDTRALEHRVPAIAGASDAAPGAPAETTDAPRRYFEFMRVQAEDTATMEQLRRLRYDVYCLECKYLDAAAFPDHLEHDEFDPHSTHFCAKNERGEMVATLRLVFDSSLGFPLESHAGPLSEAYQQLPRAKSAEISRLILAKSYRRRANDGLYGADLGNPEGMTQAELSYRRSQYPLILFGLFKEMYMESLGIGLQYWLAAMEAGLQRMLSNFGLGLKQVGEPMSYYGQVIPYYASIEELTRFVMESRPDVFKFFGQGSGS